MTNTGTATCGDQAREHDSERQVASAFFHGVRARWPQWLRAGFVTVRHEQHSADVVTVLIRIIGTIAGPGHSKATTNTISDRCSPRKPHNPQGHLPGLRSRHSLLLSWRPNKCQSIFLVE